MEESVQHICVRLDNGQDEISIFEYLNDSIQNTANAFKRSFLEHLRSIEHLSKDDLNTLQTFSLKSASSFSKTSILSP